MFHSHTFHLILYVKCKQGSLHSEHLPIIKDNNETLPLTHWAHISILRGPQINNKIKRKHVFFFKSRQISRFLEQRKHM